MGALQKIIANRLAFSYDSLNGWTDGGRGNGILGIILVCEGKILNGSLPGELAPGLSGLDRRTQMWMKREFGHFLGEFAGNDGDGHCVLMEQVNPFFSNRIVND